MKQFNIFSKLFSVFLISLLIVACASKSSPEARTDVQLYNDAVRALAKGNYRAAVTDFEALETLYPFSKFSERAKKDIIYAYYKSGDFPMTVAAADRFIHVYPRSQFVDYAYYMRGVANLEFDRTFSQRYFSVELSQRDLNTAKKAFADFNELLRRFPNSQYAPDARQRMVYLRNLFANHEINVAKHYMRRDAYLAAVNRASNVVTQYEKSPHVREALEIMINCYDQLGLTESAQEARRVFQMNYGANDKAA